MEVRPTPGPLPYHRAIAAHLKAAEPGLWEWFASSRKRDAEVEAVRLDLLKSTYRLEPQSQPKLYEFANGVREHMQLGCSVTLYQAQTGSELNAALAYLPGEAHVILAGPLTSVLSDNEVRVVLAHELAHFLLFEDQQGDYLVAADLLRALASDPVAGPAASESMRLYDLWTEIYADRWGCHVSEELSATVAALIKIETRLIEVNAESYLRQADEIFTKASVQTDQISHPEPYIRARALRLWAEQGDQAHPEIERMIERGLNLNRLDLLGQKRASHLTQQFLRTLLAPKWFQTEPVLAHARQFFADFTIEQNGGSPHEPQPQIPDRDAMDASLRGELDRGDSSLRDYLCYLLLDFVTVDRELGDVALSAAIVLARRLGIDKRFAELAQKELTLGKKAFAKIDKDAEAILAKTDSALQP
jgi:hypothetical protein